MNTKQKFNLGHARKQKGMTLIEVMLALVIVAAFAIIGSRALDANQGRARVAEAVIQVQQVMSAVTEWAPRAGIYTGVDIDDLIANGYLQVPRGADESQVTSSEMNPWQGGVTVTVNSTQSTAYDITFTNITRATEANQLANRLRQFGTNVTDTGSEVSVTVGAPITNS